MCKRKYDKCFSGRTDVYEWQAPRKESYDSHLSAKCRGLDMTTRQTAYQAVGAWICLDE